MQFIVEQCENHWNVILQSQQQKCLVRQCDTRESAEKWATLLNETFCPSPKMEIQLRDYMDNPLIVEEFFRISKIVIYEGVEYRSQEELTPVLEKDKTLYKQHWNEILQKSKELMDRMDKIK